MIHLPDDRRHEPGAAHHLLHAGQGLKNLGHLPLLPRHISRSWTASGAAVTHTCARVRCQLGRQQLNPLAFGSSPWAWGFCVWERVVAMIALLCEQSHRPCTAPTVMVQTVRSVPCLCFTTIVCKKSLPGAVRHRKIILSLWGNFLPASDSKLALERPPAKLDLE